MKTSLTPEFSDQLKMYLLDINSFKNNFEFVKKIVKKESKSATQVVGIIEECMNQKYQREKILYLKLIISVIRKAEFASVLLPKMPHIFVNLYEQIDVAQQEEMRTLRRLWSRKFDESMLNKLDAAMMFIDPQWLDFVNTTKPKNFDCPSVRSKSHAAKRKSTSLLDDLFDERQHSNSMTANHLTSVSIGESVERPPKVIKKNKDTPNESIALNNVEITMDQPLQQKICNRESSMNINNSKGMCMFCQVSNGKHAFNCLENLSVFTPRNNKKLSNGFDCNSIFEQPVAARQHASITDIMSGKLLSDAKLIQKRCKSHDLEMQRLIFSFSEECSSLQDLDGSTEQLLTLSKVAGLTGEAIKHSTMLNMVSAEILKTIKEFVMCKKNTNQSQSEIELSKEVVDNCKSKKKGKSKKNKKKHYSNSRNDASLTNEGDSIIVDPVLPLSAATPCRNFRASPSVEIDHINSIKIERECTELC